MGNRNYLIAGNWKMNGHIDTSVDVEKLINLINGDDANIILFPPYTLISQFVNISKNSILSIGGQDCHHKDSGAFTGSISAPMLHDAGANFVLIGHSEVRALHGKGSGNIMNKTQSAHENDLITIICVGEEHEVRLQGEHYNFISKQLEDSVPRTSNRNNTIIAYEPIWAIGTGKTCEANEANRICGLIRKWIGYEDVIIQYGGSVKSNNIDEIMSMSDIDGVLVGGASLDPKNFARIANYEAI